jgi:hypothetical protein
MEKPGHEKSISTASIDCRLSIKGSFDALFSSVVIFFSLPNDCTVAGMSNQLVVPYWHFGYINCVFLVEYRILYGGYTGIGQTAPRG